MSSEPTVDGLYVLSDLHLAPPGDQRVFRAHEPLVGLIDAIAAHPEPQLVVLNGDVFDFLQIPDYRTLSLPLAPARMAEILDALDAEPAERNVVQAMRRLTAAGHMLSCLPGNHDPELNLAPVQALLAQRLGSSRLLAPHAETWHVVVAGRRVMGLHGHYGDKFNAISGADMLKAQADGAAEVALPPGSKLVRDVINTYRRAKDADGVARFPFVDLLPSDFAVVLALLLVDPAKAGRQVADALGITLSAFVRSVMRRVNPAKATLAHAAAKPAEGGADFAEGLADALAGVLTAEERAAPDRMEDELMSWVSSPQPAAHGLKMLAGGHLARRWLLRALGAQLVAARDSFRPQVADALALDVMRRWMPGTIAITGHTHAAKEIDCLGGSIYINTGTWLDQVAMPAATDPAGVDAWLVDLRAGALPHWQGCPVARVDAQGARLLHWTGRAMVPWADGLGPVRPAD